MGDGAGSCRGSSPGLNSPVGCKDPATRDVKLSGQPRVLLLRDGHVELAAAVRGGTGMAETRWQTKARSGGKAELNPGAAQGGRGAWEGVIGGPDRG